MKAVIFGGSGFLGSHVADVLSDKGHEVVIFDRVPSPYLRDDQTMVEGNILDKDHVGHSLKGCDVVYHFAGISDIDEAARTPVETIESNVLGTTYILEGVRKQTLKRFIFASSLYVYSKRGSFYQTSKQSCELIIQNYQRSYGIPYTILRYGSLYGPRAGENNAIYKFIRQALDEGKIVRHGNGEEIREYIHVCDAAKDSIEILDDRYANQHVILTGQQPIKIKDLLVMIKEMFDNKIALEYVPSTDNSHYEITPYSFTPQLSQRYVGNTYFDLGQGILDCIYKLSKKEKMVDVQS